MAAMTRRWAPVRRSPCAALKSSLWRRKMSATSIAGRTRRSLGRHHHEGEALEGARRAGDQIGRDPGIMGRRRQCGMPEQDLDDADVDSALQKMRGEAVSKGVNRHRLVA